MPYSRRTQTERQIAVGRALLAAVSLAALWFDSTDRAQHGNAPLALMAAYLVYAGLLVGRRETLSRKRLQIVTHVLDIAVFSALIYLTNGPTSLFFVFFVFVLITAALRWEWRGVLLTGLTTAIAFLGLGLASALVRQNSEFELNGLMIGIAYLGVVGWFLASQTLHEQRLRRGVGELALLSQSTLASEMMDTDFDKMLALAAHTMRVQRVMFIWEGQEEPWLQIASRRNGQTTVERAALAEFSPLVAPGLEQATFLCPDARGGPGVLTMYGAEDNLQRYSGTPFHQAFADRFLLGPVISTPVNVGAGSARLLFLDKPDLNSDDLVMAGVVAAGISLMEETRLRTRLRESAAQAERVRLAGDLHDGVLQSLTGTALQLETARLLLGKDVPAGLELVKKAQRSLATEQSELREFVDQLKPRSTVPLAPAPDLRTRLLDLGANVSQQWDLEVEIALDDLDAPRAGEGVDAEVYFIVREGLVNSARHARATWARATIRSKADSLDIVLEDNGTGFPFSGRHDAASLQALGAGPTALSRRVTARGGSLVVDSSVAGSCIEISLPLTLGHAVPAKPSAGVR